MAFKQELKAFKDDEYKAAMAYYGALLALEGTHLPPKELELLAYTACRGMINTYTSKVDFTKMFDSTQASINNMISRLTRKKYFVKNKGTITVNPAILHDFKDGFVINMTCYVRPDSKPTASTE